MKDLIRKYLKEQIDEVEIANHSYERAEERVWGKKDLTFSKSPFYGVNPDPPSLGKPAWADPSKYKTINVPISGGGTLDIPATGRVEDIFRKIDFIKNKLKINVVDEKMYPEHKKILTDGDSIILVISIGTKRESGAKIWGKILDGVVKPSIDGGKLVTIQWQNQEDLSSLGSNRESSNDNPKFVIDVNYLIKNNITVVDDSNIEDIAMFPKKQKALDSDALKKIQDEKFKKIKLTDGSIVKYFPSINKFKTMADVDIKTDDIFHLLDQGLQDTVLDNL
jgi:hypothetical protein